MNFIQIQIKFGVFCSENQVSVVASGHPPNTAKSYCIYWGSCECISYFFFIFVLELFFVIVLLIFCCFICFGTWSGENALATFLESAAGRDRIVMDYVQDVQKMFKDSKVDQAQKSLDNESRREI